MPLSDFMSRRVSFLASRCQSVWRGAWTAFRWHKRAIFASTIANVAWAQTQEKQKAGEEKRSTSKDQWKRAVFFSIRLARFVRRYYEGFWFWIGLSYIDLDIRVHHSWHFWKCSELWFIWNEREKRKRAKFTYWIHNWEFAARSNSDHGNMHWSSDSANCFFSLAYQNWIKCPQFQDVEPISLCFEKGFNIGHLD